MYLKSYHGFNKKKKKYKYCGLGHKQPQPTPPQFLHIGMTGAFGGPARSVMLTVRCGGDLPVKVNLLHCIRDNVFFFSHKLAKVAVISGPFFLFLSESGHSGSYVDIRSCRYTSRLALPSRIRGANLWWYKSPTPLQ